MIASHYIGPKCAAKLAARVAEFGSMNSRELEIYLAGQADGMTVKADEVQDKMLRLEIQIGDMQAHHYGAISN